MNMLFNLFFTFMKIGFVGFGGGMAIVPLIYQGVNSFTYMSQSEFAELFAISQSTPGPIAVNTATFVGYRVAGVPGSIAATIGVSVPAFILVIIACTLIKKFYETRGVQGALTGIRPAAIGLVGSGAVVIGQGALFSAEISDAMGLSGILGLVDPVAVLIALMTFVLALRFKIGAIKLILIMGVVGIVAYSGILPV